MRGKLPYVRGDGLAPMNVESVPTIPCGCDDERAEGLGPRAARDLVDAEALAQEQVADDVHRVAPGLGHHAATVCDSQRRLSGCVKAPSRRSAQPPGPV